MQEDLNSILNSNPPPKSLKGTSNTIDKKINDHGNLDATEKRESIDLRKIQKRKKDKNIEANDLPQKKITVNKYSKTGLLYESIILNGIPLFLTLSPEKEEAFVFTTSNEITENTRILKPPSLEEYAHIPYEFSSKEEIAYYLERAKEETIFSLYKKAKYLIRKFNDQDEQIINLLAANTIFSYFQDRFGTCHYDMVVAGNGTGKSSIGDTYESIGYRVLNTTDPTAANIFRALGTVEPGQITLVLDEAERIDQSQDMINILKSGYSRSKKVSRINQMGKQEHFFAYCYKMIISERSPNKYTTKGLFDRSFIIKPQKGSSEHDIKEVLNPTDTGGLKKKELSAEVNDLRKLLLIYKCIHFHDIIEEIDIGIDGRDKELVKPIIQLFYNSLDSSNTEEKEIVDEIIRTLQYFIDSKNENKESSLEGILLPIIINLVAEEGNTIESKKIWQTIIDEIPGKPDQFDEKKYHPHDYSTLHRNHISKVIVDSFGATSKHGKHGNYLIFNKNKLERLARQNNTKIIVKPSIQVNESTDTINNGEYSEHSEYRLEKTTLKNENGDDENIHNEKETIINSEYNEHVSSLQSQFQLKEDGQNGIIYTHLYSPYSLYSPLEIDRFFTLNYYPNGHGLEESICKPLIRKNGQFYECILHRVQNIHLSEIESHIKLKDPEQHKAELLRLLNEDKSDKGVGN